MERLPQLALDLIKINDEWAVSHLAEILREAHQFPKNDNTAKLNFAEKVIKHYLETQNETVLTKREDIPNVDIENPLPVERHISEVKDLSVKEYSLTEKENEFLKNYFSGLQGGDTLHDYVVDPYTCMTVLDLRDLNPNLTVDQIKGFIGSLVKKGVLWEENDRGAGNPDLFWISEFFVDSLYEKEGNLRLK